MVYYTIAGKPDSKEFVHSVYVANYLENRLPHFKVTKIQKPCGEFEPWLLDMCTTNNWFHYKSPVIWKEITMRGGKPHLIGGIQEFWEHICHLYGIESFLSDEDIQAIVDENIKFYEQKVIEMSECVNKTRHIIVTGACNPMVVLLLPELLTIDKLSLKYGIKVYLHDFRNEPYSEDAATSEFLCEILEDIKDMLEVEIITSLKEILPICDLLLIVDDICKRKRLETFNDWFIRCLYYSYQLSDEINAYAKRDLKIIVANEGPRCFIAMAIVQACPRVRGHNIVAITADFGLKYLDALSREGEYPVAEMAGPPVWGCTGTNQFVDVQNVVLRCDMLLPYTRALTRSESSLPLGHVVTELRFAGYLVEETEELKEVAEENTQKVNDLLGRHPIPAKVRCIISFLKLWYANEMHANEIISLGVRSDGSFGIPYGLIFSQPSKLTEGRWMPYGKYPMSAVAEKEVKRMLPDVLETLEKFDLLIEKPFSQKSESELVDIYTYATNIIEGGG